jgi:hypothetical protein
MSPQALQAFSNNGGMPLNKDKKQPGKIGCNTTASEFIPGQLNNNTKKDTYSLEDSEAFQEMNSKKEFNDKFDKFLKERSALIASNETDSLDVEKIRNDREKSIEMDVEQMTKK